MYVQGFLIAVPEDKKEAYLAVAAKSAEKFAEYGVTEIVENWEEDVTDGKVTDFRMATKAKPDERIVFSWMIWPDKATCDAASEKMRDACLRAAAERASPALAQAVLHACAQVFADVHHSISSPFGVVSCATTLLLSFVLPMHRWSSAFTCFFRAVAARPVLTHLSRRGDKFGSSSSSMEDGCRSESPSCSSSSESEDEQRKPFPPAPVGRSLKLKVI